MRDEEKEERKEERSPAHHGGFNKKKWFLSQIRRQDVRDQKIWFLLRLSLGLLRVTFSLFPLCSYIFGGSFPYKKTNPI